MRKRSARPLLELLEPRTVPTVYNVGPGQAYTTIGAVPWNNLQPGDTVDIHWQATPYHEKISLAASGTAAAPISIVGVPNAQGQLPVIAGDGATTSPNAPTFGYTPLQDLGVVLIAADSAHPYGYVPSYINLENLQVQGGNPGVSYTASGGGKRTYNESAAGIWVEEGTNINIEGCTITDNGNGLFVLSRGSTATDSANILVQGNHIYGNGVANSDQQHNVYTQVNGITFQYNEFGPLRAGAGGNNLKDRSAGTVIRYNYFDDGAHVMDLVDPEDAQDYASLPSFKTTYVYGNVILDDNSGAEQLIHFGGDSGLSDYRNGTLYFYDNTIVTRIDQSTYYRLAMFELDGSNTQTVDAFNNIFYNVADTPGATPTQFEFSEEQGNFNFGSNWVSPGWLASESQELGVSYSGTITGTNNFVVDPSNNPGFANLAAGDVHLASGSSLAVGKGQALISGTTAFPVNDQYVYHQSFQTRPNINDLGAFAYGGSTTGSVASLSVSAPSGATAGASFSVTVTAKDAAGNTAAGYTGTVHFTSSDGMAGLPADYTFTSADAGAHTFTVTLKTAGSETVTATDTSSGSLTGNAGVNVTPAAAASYSVTTTSSTVSAGAPFTVTVTAKDAYGNVATGYRGTVHFTSSDGQAALPGNYTFASADNGAHNFNVTLNSAGSQTVTATDAATGSITGNTALTVSPVAASLAVSTSVTTATAGASFTVTVKAEDGLGNVVTGYLGTVHFTSSDGQAVLPGNYTFTTNDAGVHKFTVTLKTAASESVTVTDTSNSSVTGSAAVSVSPAAASSFTVKTSTASPTAGGAFTVTVTAKDAYGNLATGYRGTVALTSSDGQAALPANYPFVAADNGVHTFNVTLKTAGSQSVTGGDTSNSSLKASANVTVSPGATSVLVVSGVPSSDTAGTAFSVTVTAKDAYGNTTTGYSGSVHFASSDAAAALPSDYTFKSADAGVHMFSVTLKTAGSRGVTVSDSADGLGPYSNSVTVTPGAASLSASTTSLAPASLRTGATSTVTLTARDAFGNPETTGGLVVAFGLGGGTGGGSFGTVTDNGNGTYAATFTAGAIGTNTVTATIGGQAVTATAPRVTVLQESAPVVQPIGDVTLAHGQFPAKVTVQASSPVGAPLTLSAAATADSLLYDLQAQYRFTAVGRQTAGATAYVLHSGQPGPGVMGYYLIRPADGALFAYDGSASYATTFANGTPLATLGANVYADPALLLAAQPPVNYPALYALEQQYRFQPMGLRATADGVTAYVFQSAQPGPGVGGYYLLRADGALFAYDGSATYGQTFAKNAPLGGLGAGVYANPSLLLNAQATPGLYPQLAQVMQRYALQAVGYQFAGATAYVLTSAAGNNASGNPYYLLRSDGALFAYDGSGSYAHTFQNGTPLADLTAAVFATPSLLLDATAPEAATGLTATLSGGTLTLNAPASFVGTVRVTVTASDGILTTAQSFRVTSTDTAPLPAAVPPQAASRSGSPLQVALGAADAEGDPVTFSAQAVGSSAAYNLQQIYHFTGGTRMTTADGVTAVVLKSGVPGGVGGYYLISAGGGVYAYDGASAYGLTFGNAKNLVAQLDPSVFANPTLLTSAQAPAALPSGVVGVSGNTLSVNVSALPVGTVFQILVTASDGAETGQTSFVVTVTA